MTLLQYCGLAFLTIVAVFLLRDTARPYTHLVTGAFLLLGFFVAIGHVAETITYFREKISDVVLLSYLEVVLKAVGVAFVGQVTSDLSRGAGENVIAEGVEICTKTEIILISLPLVTEIIEKAELLL